MEKIKNFFKTLWKWISRTFRGPSRAMYADDPFAVEKLESPSKMAFKAFFRRKIQVIALIVLVAMFLFVFITPLFVPISYVPEPAIANMSPNLTLRTLPKGLKNNVKSISSSGTFSVGISNDNEMYIWGYTRDNVLNIDYANIPSELKGKKVAFAAVGVDHCIAITEEGKVVGWGNRSLAQYGRYEGLSDESGAVVFEPEELMNGTIDVNNVKQLVCKNQTTAILMKDGTFYMWGNNYATTNMSKVLQWRDENPGVKVKEIALSNTFAFLLLEDGSIISDNKARNNNALGIDAFKGRTVEHIACDNYTLAALFPDGTIETCGAFEYNEDKVPELKEGVKYVSVTAGARHYAAVTDEGKVYTWGSDFYNQTDFNGTKGAKAYAVSNQTYICDENGKLLKSCGLAGFIMGTDGFGRDLFARIVHGGKLTMTIGAVAVIISTIISIIVGCLSGYFGGWVDMLLMRITEIFSAIPFLPFAMMLSVVISNYNIDENTRIFIIMVILGFLSWTGLAKMIRGQVLAEREKEFVIAAKAMGVKESRIAFKHILPNVISVVLVSVTLDFAGCMLTESSLSYLGFGVQPPKPTWGNMLNGCNNSTVIKYYWWEWLFPSLFLGIATISINIIGDGLRDVLDPKSSAER